MPRALTDGPSRQSGPALHVYGLSQSPRDRSYETVASAAASGSFEQASDHTDPTSGSDSSSIQKVILPAKSAIGTSSMQAPPMAPTDDYGINFGNDGENQTALYSGAAAASENETSTPGRRPQGSGVAPPVRRPDPALVYQQQQQQQQQQQPELPRTMSGVSAGGAVLKKQQTTGSGTSDGPKEEKKAGWLRRRFSKKT